MLILSFLFSFIGKSPVPIVILVLALVICFHLPVFWAPLTCFSDLRDLRDEQVALEPSGTRSLSL